MSTDAGGEPDLAELIGGFRISQALAVAATLGVPDALHDRPSTASDLADRLGADADALHRLLRALASVGVLRRHQGGRFALARAGERLRSDHPQSLHARAVLTGRSYFWSAWGNLIESIRTGENAFAALFGTDVWSYRAERPDESRIFDAYMRSTTELVNAAVASSFDFSRFRTVVDVAGGTGAMLAAILAAHPGVRGILFDQPHVVANAPAVLSAAGVEDRCETVGGSFFDHVPRGGDAYVLKSIIHDWEDEQAVRILRNCREAIEADAVVLLVEHVVDESPNAEVAFLDLNMLVLPGGRERTLGEYARLFEAAGLALSSTTPTSAGVAVVEASAA